MHHKDSLSQAIRNIYTINLGVKREEDVLVFCDYPAKEEEIEDNERERRKRLLFLTERVADIGRGFCNVRFLTYPSLGCHGIEPPEEVWKVAFGERIYGGLVSRGLLPKILKKEISLSSLGEVYPMLQEFNDDVVDAVIALSNYSTSHTIFRDLITRARGRYASMPLFDEAMFYGPMTVDWDKMKIRTERLAGEVNKGDAIEITSPNGTHLTFSIKGRKVMVDTGILTGPGSFGNLPAGEVFLAPVEGTAKGRLVLEWAPTYKLESKVILKIENGMVEEVKGDDPYKDELARILDREANFRNIAELGIGTNDMARRPDNILESEKILGTIHIALGDNSSFGGNVRTPFHQDFIVFEPTLSLILPSGEKKTILYDGRLIL